eukprot:476325-Hanusia_phi.AAC.1
MVLPVATRLRSKLQLFSQRLKLVHSCKRRRETAGGGGDVTPQVDGGLDFFQLTGAEGAHDDCLSGDEARPSDR